MSDKQQPKGLKQRLDYNADFELDWRDPEEAHDGYQLKWVGKNYARLEAGLETDTVIIPDTAHNSAAENANSENLFFTGDNLHVLKHLQNCYKDAVKMIYIAPPYNTGSDGFVYPDKFDFSDEKLQSMLGLSPDDVKRLKIINGRSSHSAWLTFMYPRLKIARELLAEDGVIFISIDDNEQANLKLLCDEIFDGRNFVAQLNIVTGASQNGDGVKIQKNVEYCLVYSKSEYHYNPIKVDKADESLRNLNDAPSSLETRLDMGYSIYYNPQTKDIIPQIDYDKSKVYLNTEKSVYTNNNELISNGYIPIRPGIKNGNLHRWRWSIDTFIKRKEYVTVEKKGDKYSIFFKQSGFLPPKNILNFTIGTQQVQNLFDGKSIFPYPKNISYLRYLCSFNTATDDIILDFFAGSGTTAHAVMELNKQDGGNRRYILCQIDELVPEDSEARKVGYETIDQIAQERIKRAAAKLGDKSGFKHYLVQEPPADTLDKITEFDPDKPALIADNMVAEFACPATGATGEQTLLTTWAAADGYKFTDTIKPLDIAGYTAHYAENGRLYLIAQGWGAEQTKALLKRVGTHELNINSIILCPYSFSFESLRELEIGCKQNLDKGIVLERRG